MPFAKQKTTSMWVRIKNSIRKCRDNNIQNRPIYGTEEATST